MNEHTETEIKLYAPDLDAVEARLQTLGAELKMARAHEYNLRFDHPALQLAERRVVLRLRQDQHTTLTYKDSAKLYDDIVSRFEAEVCVGHFANTKLILEKLGFVISASYEKYRSKYSLADAEIVLDELPFGNFVEIEAVREDIAPLIERLELSLAPRLPFSYLQLFAHAQAWAQDSLGIAIENLSFENFAGIQVPLAALKAQREGTNLE